MINNKDLNSITYCSRIDTLETRENVNNREDITINHIKGIEECLDKKSNVKTKYNPNNFGIKYSNEYKLSETVNTLNQMQTVLTVIDTSKVEFKRIDIATDIDEKFDTISKFLDLAHKCIRAKKEGGNAWNNTSEQTLNITNYLFRKKFNIEIEFYNKELESKGVSKFPTRLELRFLRISSKDFKLHIKNAINLWYSMSLNLQLVEDKMIEMLKEKWVEEKKLNEGLAFTTFIYKWSDKIFTLRILKELYDFAELKGSYKSWLQEYRKKHVIEFYTSNQLKNFSKNIIKSLKMYSKN
ncbi:hypothetical protein FC764_16945 [Clostridium botulinum]|nr:hypothetical protein [Clostridium botulinum]